MTRKLYAWILMLMLLITGAVATDYELIGNSVTQDYTHNNMTVTPATVIRPNLNWQQFEVCSHASAFDLCGAYVFNDPLVWGKARLWKNYSHSYTHCITEDCTSTETRYSHFYDWQDVSTQFKHVSNAGNEIYYTQNPLSFSAWECHNWSIKYQPANNSGKWELWTWDSPSGNCKTDYQTAAYTFLNILDPWYTEATDTDGFPYLTNHTWQDTYEDYENQLIDNYESATGYTTSGDVTGLTTSTDRKEREYSLEYTCDVTASGSTFCSITNLGFEPIDLTSLNTCHLWLYIDDVSQISSIYNAVRLDFDSEWIPIERYQWYWGEEYFTNGWNKLEVDLYNPDFENPTFDFTNLNTTRLIIYHDDTTDFTVRTDSLYCYDRDNYFNTQTFSGARETVNSENISNWYRITDAVDLKINRTHKEGFHSIEYLLDWDAAGGTNAVVYQDGNWDFSGQDSFRFWIYVENINSLNSATHYVDFRSSLSSNYNRYYFPKPSSNGWTLVELDLTSPNYVNGVPNMGSVIRWYISLRDSSSVDSLIRLDGMQGYNSSTFSNTTRWLPHYSSTWELQNVDNGNGYNTTAISMPDGVNEINYISGENFGDMEMITKFRMDETSRFYNIVFSDNKENDIGSMNGYRFVIWVDAATDTRIGRVDGGSFTTLIDSDTDNWAVDTWYYLKANRYLNGTVELWYKTLSGTSWEFIFSVYDASYNYLYPGIYHSLDNVYTDNIVVREKQPITMLTPYEFTPSFIYDSSNSSPYTDATIKWYKDGGLEHTDIYSSPNDETNFSRVLTEAGIWYANIEVCSNGVCADNDTQSINLTWANFSISARDYYNGSTLLTFNATINGILHTTTTGTILTQYLKADANILDIVVEAEDYQVAIYNNHNSSSDLSAFLVPQFVFNDVGYSNFESFAGNDYARNITYTLNITCNSTTTTSIQLYANGVNVKNDSFTCNNAPRNQSYGYKSATEGEKNLSITIVNDFATVPSIGNKTVIYDLNAPTGSATYKIKGGFNSSVNVSLFCNDTIMPNLTYNLSFNDVSLLNGFFVKETNISAETNITDGTNRVSSVCSDLFDSTPVTYNQTSYLQTLYLVYEINGSTFDLTNITVARVYFLNSSFYDFKAEGTSQVIYATDEDVKLRFELGYEDGTIITRHVDVTLVDTDIKICANSEGTTYFEQLIVSAIEKPVLIRNTFTDCIIAADYTRFAFQDALILKAYTIDSLYYLYTVDTNNDPILLASVDGSISTSMNLDTIAFNQQGYNLNILGDSLTFEKTNTNEVTIYYENMNNDTEEATLTITNLNTQEVLLTTSSLSDPNQFTVVFDYSTLNVNSSHLLQFQLEKTDAEGTVSVVKRYFNTQADSGKLKNKVAFVIALLLLIFGLTFVASRITFSWFGIVIEIGALAILSLAVGSMYITFLGVITMILLLFTVIMMINLNTPTVA